jgi:hypothetical protein
MSLREIPPSRHRHRYRAARGTGALSVGDARCDVPGARSDATLRLLTQRVPRTASHGGMHSASEPGNDLTCDEAPSLVQAGPPS